MEDEANLSSEWVERDRPPTIRFNGTVNSLSGSVNVLSDKPANWANVHEVASRDIFTKPKTGLERMFAQPPDNLQEGLSVVEEAMVEDDADVQERDVARQEQSESHTGTVRSADGMYANFSFPFRPESQARLRAEDAAGAGSSDATAYRAPAVTTSPLVSITPRKPATSTQQSPIKSPLKLFHNEYDTFTNDKLTDMINILGARPPPPMQALAEEVEQVAEPITVAAEFAEPASKTGTGKSHQSGVSAQTEVTDHDMGPERKRPKHEAKGSITTQNFYNEANDVMARLKMKGGALGKGLPRVAEDGGSGGVQFAGTTPHPRKASGGLLQREEERRRMHASTVPRPSGFEAMNIPVDQFAGPGFGASAKSHFSDWTSETCSRSVSGATTRPSEDTDKEMRMFDSVKQTWVTTPTRMAAADVSMPPPAQAEAAQNSATGKQPKYQNIPPDPNMTLRNGDMVFSRSRQEWRHISESAGHETLAAEVNATEQDLEQEYPDELEFSNSESELSARREEHDASMRSLPQRQVQGSIDASGYERQVTKVTEHGGRYADEVSELAEDADASTVDGNVTMSQSTADLVAAISKRYPIDIWEHVTNADLSGLRLRSLTGLYKCFPNLIKLDVSNNQLSHLTDLPESLQELDASRNKLDALTSFSHLPNLQCLTLNENELEDLEGLGKLPHLLHLKVDNNALQTAAGLELLSSLVSLSAKHNQLLDFEVFPGELQSLETLDLSDNQLEAVVGLADLVGLLSLNLDKNALQVLDLGGEEGRSMPKLKMIRVSDNDLWSFDMHQVPNVRVLYLDNNAIANLPMPPIMKHLQSLSLRRQHASPLFEDLDLGPLQEVERLYLSGNAMHRFQPPTAFLSLKYLELAGCQLTELPDASLLPNVRVLNLSSNSLSSTAGLAKLTRLERLLLHGNKLTRMADLSASLRALDKLKVLDVRGNPFTTGFYAESATLSASAVGEPVDYFAGFDVFSQHEREREAWQKLDEVFRETLAPAVRERREVYQQLVWSVCRSLRWHDGRRLSRDELVLADRAESF